LGPIIILFIAQVDFQRLDSIYSLSLLPWPPLPPCGSVISMLSP